VQTVSDHAESLAAAAAAEAAAEKLRLADERRREDEEEAAAQAMRPVSADMYAREIFERHALLAGIPGGGGGGGSGGGGVGGGGYGGSIHVSELYDVLYDLGVAVSDEYARNLTQLLLDRQRLNTFGLWEGEMETNITQLDFEQWWQDHGPQFQVPAVYTPELRAAIFYFKKHDGQLRGSLSQEDFSGMCNEMGWSKEDTKKSLDLLQSDGGGHITLRHYLQWYTDDGMVRNVMVTFDIDQDDQLSFGEFDRLCHEVCPTPTLCAQPHDPFRFCPRFPTR
jgi:hypothetical protein